MLHRRRRHDGDGVASHQPHQLAAAAGELVFGNRFAFIHEFALRAPAASVQRSIDDARLTAHRLKFIEHQLHADAHEFDQLGEGALV